MDINNQKGFANIVLIIVILVLVGAVGYFAFVKKSEPVTQKTAALSSSTNPTFEQKLIACDAAPNNSVQRVKETTRRFISLPKDIYPYAESNVHIKTVNGNATMGWVSNGGLPGQGLYSNDNPQCWSTYYEFSGSGKVDLLIKSSISGIPDYSVSFIVGSAQ